MNELDKRLKELSSNLKVPEEYEKRVDELLDNLPEKNEVKPSHGNRYIKRGLIAAAIGLVFAGMLIGVFGSRSNANIFEMFRKNIMDIFSIGNSGGNDTDNGSGPVADTDDDSADEKGLGKNDKRDADEQMKDIGVESEKENVIGKQNLMLEIKERIIDKNGIYLLFELTAPADIRLDEDITFDYFCVCEGEYYSGDHLIAGAVDCYMLERAANRDNVAEYVLTFSGDMAGYEGEMVTAYFKDLTRDPNGSAPEILVEGMWSFTFSADMTVRKEIEITGDENMTFPFINTTASVEWIRITPLGYTMLSDVSKVPYDDLGISDTSISLRLKTRDGSEILIAPYDPDGNYIVDNGSIEYSNEGDRVFQKNIYTFTNAIDINDIVGVYVQGVFVPVQ